MTKGVQLYLASEIIATHKTITGQPLSDGVTTHYCTVKETSEETYVMPEIHRAFYETVEEWADARSLPLKVFNVSTLSGKLHARLNGVKNLPAVIYGDFRIEGNCDIDELKKRLQSCQDGARVQ